MIQNKNLYPIIIFLRELFSLFYKYIQQRILFLFLSSPTPSPPPPPRSPMEIYAEKRKGEFQRFIETPSSLETNIHPLYYDKTLYKDYFLHSSTETEEETLWKSRILLETTPRGNILLYYNPFQMGFSYYSDMNGIPYSLLNLVAMKYVATFRCLDFFMDNMPFSSPLYDIHYAPDKQATIIGREQMVKTKPKTKEDNKTEDTPTTKEEENHYNKFNSMGKLSNFNLLKTPPSIKTDKKTLTNKLVLPELYEEEENNNNNNSINYKKSFQDFYREFQQQKQQYIDI